MSHPDDRNLAHHIDQDVKIFEQLLGPDEYGTGDCPPGCGCPETKQDCPSWYSVDALQQSAGTQDSTILAHHDKLLHDARSKALVTCNELDEQCVQKTGGWCLYPVPNSNSIISHPNGVSYPLSEHHVSPAPRVVREMISLFRNESTTSINEFGAGIAQYKAAITSALPHIQYHAYDGAGNGEEYTKGMMMYADLTLPLNLAVADWVISLEVGEHIPSKYEGIFIRNLHRHNRRGIILSWATLGQRGHSHINCHSNDYVKRILTSLGYEHDIELSAKMRRRSTKDDNFWWFQTSMMVFRKMSSMP